MIGTALFYITIPRLGAGIATLIACSYVVFSILLAAWVLREKLTVARIIWVAVAFFGLGMLTLPGATAKLAAPVWFLLAFAGALVAAGCVVLIRSLHRTEGTGTIYWAQCGWGLVLTAPILLGVLDDSHVDEPGFADGLRVFSPRSVN